MQLKKYDLFIRFVQYPVYQWLYIGCYINDVTVNIILRIFLQKKLKSSCQCGKGQEIWPLLRCRTHVTHARSQATATFYTFVHLLHLKLLIHSFTHTQFSITQFTVWGKSEQNECIQAELFCPICVTLYTNDEKTTWNAICQFRLRWMVPQKLILNHICECGLARVCKYLILRVCLTTKN